MTKSRFLLTAFLTLAMVAVAFAGAASKMDLKVGDEIFACNCGEKCPCQTMSKNKGQCTCKKDMVKAKVTAVDAGKVTLQGLGWEKPRIFSTTGKFACACGEKCKCDTISQQKGKCTCGKKMKKVV